MPEIRVLPKSISDLIAAGEVVERPASVIKELLENSIDAGAKNITVEIMNGGVSFIRVTDDGCGIKSDNVKVAFLSHATSKITTAEDLDSICTLGFRGEALASVAAVAKVDLMTKTADEQFGTHYCIEGGEEREFSAVGCPDGTTIVVSDLFFNTPARMKFLKKDVTEGNAVSEVVDKTALSHPEISFRFIRDSKQVLITSGNGDSLSVIYSVLGKEFASSVIPVIQNEKSMSVSGFITKPISCRGSRSMQYFFLNGRSIKSSTAVAALENAYKNSAMVGRFPGCVLNITVDPSEVDVNVHPAKTEVRFSDERAIFNLIYSACVGSLSEHDTRPAVNLNKQVQRAMKGSHHSFEQVRLSDDKPTESKSFWQNLSNTEFLNSLNNKPEHKNSTEKQKNVIVFSDIEKDQSVISDEGENPDLLCEYFSKKQNEIQTDVKKETDIFVPETDETTAENGNDKTVIKVIGEAFKTYIIAQVDEKIVIIDKHAAHERMIFNSLKNRSLSSQFLLSPVVVHLDKMEYSAIIENLDLLKKAGYDAEDFGIGSVIVRECPLRISPEDIPLEIQEIASHFMENSMSTDTEKIDWVYHSASCRAAIKAGDGMTLREMQTFAESILADNDIRYCPHGRPVLIELTRNELEKQFGRIQ